MSDFNIKKAGERLIWRLRPDSKGNYKPFKPNESDFKALETILGRITSESEAVRLNNVMFTKLFITSYKQIMLDYDTDVLDKNVKEILFKELRLPLHIYYERFNEFLQMGRMDSMLDKLKENGSTSLQIEDIKDCFSNENQIKTLNAMVDEALQLDTITRDEVLGQTKYVEPLGSKVLTDIGFDYLISDKATEQDLNKALLNRQMTEYQRKMLLCVNFKSKRNGTII